MVVQPLLYQFFQHVHPSLEQGPILQMAGVKKDTLQQAILNELTHNILF